MKIGSSGSNRKALTAGGKKNSGHGSSPKYGKVFYEQACSVCHHSQRGGLNGSKMCAKCRAPMASNGVVCA